MGHKNLKGTVSVTNYKQRIRLRWRHQGNRYSLNLLAYNKVNLLQAKETVWKIEQDIALGQFDSTLQKYNVNTAKTKVTLSPAETPLTVRADTNTRTTATPLKSVVEYFEDWTSNYKQMDCNKHCNYNQVRNMLKSWGSVSEQNILEKFNTAKIGEVTYNRRLTMLRDFSGWLVKHSQWTVNPFEDVKPRKNKKVVRVERLPLSVEEIKRILEAFKNDIFCPKAARFKHSYYHPFLYFIFRTGVRNGEAIGLRVSSIDFQKELITIKEVLSKTLKGNHAGARIRKETKNGKVRMLPLTGDLKELLLPLTINKAGDDLVFKSPKGMAIDDRMFQVRIYRKVLEKLGIEKRHLYACRHTFGSRCIDEGLTPVMTSFLMGNNPETVLRSYTHQIDLPKELPSISD